MLETFSPVFFIGVAVLIGGFIFSKDDDASMGDVCEGGVLYGAVMIGFFAGIPFI